jgi:tetratricopeptide (TPR) repeat protein
MVGAYQTFWSGDGDYALARELCSKALTAQQDRAVAPQGPPIEMDALNLEALASLSAGAYADAVHAYSQAAEVARADGYPGIAATYLAFGVNARVLGGLGAEEAIAEAEDSATLARESGMPGAIVQSLTTLALALAEHDPPRARALLDESIERGGGEHISGNYVACSMVAGRLRDWDLTVTLTARAMDVWLWDMSPLWAAICFAECARAVAEDNLEVAGILRGAAYAAFRQASPVDVSARPPDSSPVDASANFVLTALRETGDLVAAALGDDRRRQLRAEGAAMSVDEAIAYALEHIDLRYRAHSVELGGAK